jgi:hypothetical protein
VVVAFNATSNLILFFHDACHKALTTKQVERIARDNKWDMMLTTLDDQDECTRH